MPDTATTGERPVVGVRVHFNDGRSPVLHRPAARYLAAEDGTLNVYIPSPSTFGPSITHAPMEWAWAELVYAEPTPPPVADDRIQTVKYRTVPLRHKTPAEVAAQRDVAAAQDALARAVSAYHQVRRDLDDRHEAAAGDES